MKHQFYRSLSLHVLLILLVFLCIGCDVTNKLEETHPCIFCDESFFTIDSEPAWSPDSNKIAYVGTDATGKLGIYLISSNGKNKRLFHSGNVGSPSWSPDNNWLVFHENAQIFKKHIETDSLVQLTQSGRNFFPDWSPDSDWIAYDNTTCGSSNEPPPANSCGVLILNSEISTKMLVKRYSRMPTWKPFANEISFVNRAVLPSGKVKGDSLWTYSLKDSTTSFLTFIEGDNRYLKYSPDGMRLLFTSQPYASQTNIYLLDLHEKSIKQLTTKGAYSNDWSPDGAWIVYTEASKTGRLWLMKPDGSEKKQLTYEN